MVSHPIGGHLIDYVTVRDPMGGHPGDDVMVRDPMRGHPRDDVMVRDPMGGHPLDDIKVRQPIGTHPLDDIMLRQLIGGLPLDDIMVKQPIGGLSYPTVGELLRSDDHRPTLLPRDSTGRKQEMKTTYRKSIKRPLLNRRSPGEIDEGAGTFSAKLTSGSKFSFPLFPSLLFSSPSPSSSLAGGQL